MDSPGSCSGPDKRDYLLLGGRGFSRECTSASDSVRTGASRGYSRRQSDSTGRRPTDRDEYVAFLEEQLEGSNEAFEMAREAHQSAAAVGSDLASLVGRVDDVEAQLRSTTRTLESLQEELHERMRDTSRTLERTEAGDQAEWLACRESLEERMGGLEELLRRSEASAEATAVSLLRGITEAKAFGSAELARLRNEVALSLQELGQRLGEQAALVESAASQASAEAQATCARLADDALAASEAAQRRLEDLARRAESNFEVLGVDLTALRAEVAGVLEDRKSSLAILSAAEPQSELARGGASDAALEGLERRLQTRVGQQVLQLSEVLRRVVQAQVAMHTSHAQVAPQPTAPLGPIAELQPQTPEADELYRDHRQAIDDTRRRTIDELYKELRELEQKTEARAGKSHHQPVAT